jgi:cellulose synthase operon protein C
MLCNILLALALPAAPPQSQSLDQLLAAEQSAYQEWADDHPAQAAYTLADAIRGAAEDLPHIDAGSAADGAALASELEFALAMYRRYSSELNNQTLRRTLLADVEIAPHFGGAHARLEWMREDGAETLGMLQNWQWVGPFDNERGAAMEEALAPESRPHVVERYDGKVREIAWRSLPAMANNERLIRLQPLMQPAEQAAAIARTWVQSDKAQQAVLYLGFSSELRVWLNGVPLLDAFDRHNFRRDAYAVPLALKAGWNELTLKLGGRERGAQWTARLAEPGNGAPIHLPSMDQSPDGVAPLPLSSAAAPVYDLTAAPWKQVAGLRFQLARAGEEHDNARIWFRRSLLEELDQSMPGSSHPGRAAAAKAAALDADNVRYGIQYARTLSQHQELAAEKDVNPWLQQLHRVLDLEPGLPRVLRHLARHASYNQPTYLRALRLLDEAAQRDSQSVLAVLLRAQILSRMDENALAKHTMRRLLEHERIRDYPRVMLRALDSLSAAERLFRHYEFIVGAHYFPSAIREYARKARLRDASVDSLMLQAKLHQQWSSWGLGWRKDIAMRLIAAGRLDDAMGMLADAQMLSPEDAEIYKLMARAHWLAGREDSAIAALEEELRLDFNAEDDRRLLQHLRSKGAAPFHEEYQEAFNLVLERVDALQKNQGNAAVTADEASSFETLLKRVVIKVHPDGTAHRYNRLIRRVLNERGARDLDQISFYGAPRNQEVRILTANVHHADGRINEASTSRSGRYGGTGVDLPPLAAGDVIDIEYRLDDLRVTFFGNYFSLNEALADTFTTPTWLSEITLLVPDEFPLALHQRGFENAAQHEQLADGSHRYQWQLQHLDAISIEAGMPPPTETAPMVQASSYADWQQFGTWWWDLIEEEIRVSPAMQSKIAALTANATTNEEKLTAIYNFVITDIRYNAWEFGVHGYQPYSAPVIFSRGFGDCKDKAILLRAMLGEVGIESYPVLIQSSGRREQEDLTLAMVNHFNHCIAYIPAQSGLDERFLDGTARLHPLNVLPESDQGAEVLVVKPDGAERKKIPFADADQNRLEHRFVVDLADPSGPSVRYTRVAHGRFDVNTRHRFTGSVEQQKERAEAMITSLFGSLNGELELAQWPDFEDLSAPMEMTFVARPASIGRSGDRGMELPVSFNRFELLQGVGSESTRGTDLLMASAWSQSSQIQYLLPASARAEALAAVNLQSDHLDYHRDCNVDGTTITLREDFRVKQHRLPAAAYDSFRQSCRQIDDAQNQFLQIDLQP